MAKKPIGCKVIVSQRNSPTGVIFEARTLPNREHPAGELIRYQKFPHTDDDDERRMNYWHFTEPLILRGYYPSFPAISEKGKIAYYAVN